MYSSWIKDRKIQKSKEITNYEMDQVTTEERKKR